MLHNDAA